MMRGPRLTAIVLALGVWLMGCDRMPSDPGLDPELDAALAAAEAAAGTSAPHTLPDLLRQAITTTHEELGRDAARDVTRTWLRLSDEARSAVRSADRQSAYARLNEVHQEELRIVLHVFGNDVVGRTISAIEAGVAAARADLAEASRAGKDVARSANLVSDITADLAEARAAEARGEAERALDRATAAAVTLGAVRSFIGWLNRVEGLEALFPEAITRLEQGAGREAERVRSAIDLLTWRMQTALNSGDHVAARRASEDIRRQQIAIVLRVFGSGRVHRLTTDVGAAVAASRRRLDELEKSGRDVARHRRMLREAESLHERAVAALAGGDEATALDLASHAAGLVNTLGQI